MVSEDKMLQSALWYREHMGFSVIPVGHNKTPLITREHDGSGGWEPYQREKPSADLIREWWSGDYKGANIGIITGAISNLTVVDIDSKDGSRDGFDAIEEITPDGLLTPTASSPSGGEHRYFTFLEGSRNKVRFLPDCDLRSEGGYIIAPPSQNGRGPYGWKDGLSIAEIPVCKMPVSYSKVLKGGGVGGGIVGCGQNGGFSNDHNVTTLTTSDHKIIPHTRDNTLFHIANALIKGNLPVQEVQEILYLIAAHGCEEPYPEKDIPKKIKSVLDRHERQNQNISQMVREWVLTTTGHFLTTDNHRELGLTTRDHKKAANMALLRLVDEKVIEKYGDKRGCYRLIERDFNTEMRFIDGPVEEFGVKLPFGLNGICSIFAKNIIVVAGSKSAGKTALLMNIAKMNQDHNEVVYFNSEMGDEEWSRRLKQMGIEKQEDLKFKAYGIHKNFHDMMDEKKKIFIIDFLEIHDNFYEIAKHIRLIHEVIKDGICIIAIQKKQGQMMARGADFSMEKARLYLSLDFLEGQRCSQMTIVDAKSPKVADSLRGWKKRIKIMNGVRMEALDENWTL